MVDTVTIIIIAHNPCRHALVPSLVRRLFEYLPRKWNCSLGGRGCIYQAGLEGKERLCRLASPHCWASSSTWDRAQGHLLTAPSPPSLSAGCSEAASEGAVESVINSQGVYRTGFPMCPSRLLHMLIPFTSSPTVSVISQVQDSH